MFKLLSLWNFADWFGEHCQSILSLCHQPKANWHNPHKSPNPWPVPLYKGLGILLTGLVNCLLILPLCLLPMANWQNPHKSPNLWPVPFYKGCGILLTCLVKIESRFATLPPTLCKVAESQQVTRPVTSSFVLRLRNFADRSGENCATFQWQNWHNPHESPNLTPVPPYLPRMKACRTS